ncbi:hypothetical protein A252_09589, partial [Pseudomonas syringae pv. actinidiae ICMP 9855]
FCGSELVREEGGAVDAFLRLEYSLREQVRSYRHPRAFVGANLFAKRAVQSMHFCVWNNAFANKFAPTGIHDAFAGANLFAKREVQSMHFLRLE